MAPRPWIVLPSDPPQRLEDNLLCVHGQAPKGGASLKRTMTVMRRADGRLVIHSAIALDEEGMRSVEALGEPAFLVVPNAFHRLDAHAYKVRYPALRVLCPAPAVSAVRRVVEVDGVLTDLPSDPAVQVEVIEGFRLGEGVITVRSGATSTLVFNDIVLNLERLSGPTGLVFRMLGGRIGPGLHPVQRHLVNWSQLRAQLDRLAGTPGLRRLIPGHGAIVEGDVPQVLRTLVGAPS